MERNAYLVLGVNRNATQGEIEQAYKRLSEERCPFNAAGAADFRV